MIAGDGMDFSMNEQSHTFIDVTELIHDIADRENRIRAMSAAESECGAQGFMLRVNVADNGSETKGSHVIARRWKPVGGTHDSGA